MSKGQWTGDICRCGTCRKCKDRARKAAKRAGLEVKYIPQGRKVEREAAAAKVAKAALKAEKAEVRAQIQAQKEKARKHRAGRSIAFKHNVEQFGLLKAKFIANLITAK